MGSRPGNAERLAKKSVAPQRANGPHGSATEQETELLGEGGGNNGMSKGKDTEMYDRRQGGETGTNHTPKIGLVLGGLQWKGRRDQSPLEERRRPGW